MNVPELLDELVAMVGDHLLRRFQADLAMREAVMLAQAERHAGALDQDGAGAAADHVRRRAVALLGESRAMNGTPAPAAELPSVALPGPGIEAKGHKRRGGAKSSRQGAGVEGTLAQITEESEATLADIDAAAARFNGAVTER